jgi:hypothetical protein
MEHKTWDVGSFGISRSVELWFRTDVGSNLPIYDA